MKKIFVDLGEYAVGILKNYGSEEIPRLYLDVLEEETIDDGAISPPQHVFIDCDGLQSLYDALKSIYEPPA